MSVPGESPPPVVVGIKHDQPGLLRFALSWAERWGVALRVVHAYDFLDIAAEVYSAADNGNGPILRAQEVMDEARESLAGIGTIPVEYSLNENPATSALDIESKQAKALMVATDSTRGVRHLIGGAVAHHAAMHSRAPVFVVRPGVDVETPRDIVLAIDENNVGEGPIRFAYETARLCGARLHVVHVTSRTAHGAEDRHGARLAQIVETWGADHPDVEASRSLMRGDVVDELLIASTSSQLIIIGRPNEPHHGQFLGLKVAETLIRASQCPVAVVPAEYAS